MRKYLYKTLKYIIVSENTSESFVTKICHSFLQNSPVIFQGLCQKAAEISTQLKTIIEPTESVSLHSVKKKKIRGSNSRNFGQNKCFFRSEKPQKTLSRKISSKPIKFNRLYNLNCLHLLYNANKQYD